MKCVDVFSTMLLAFQATPSAEGSPSQSRLDLLRVEAAKMASTMASTMTAVSIDPSGPVSAFKRKLVRDKSGLFVTIWSQ